MNFDFLNQELLDKLLQPIPIAVFLAVIVALIVICISSTLGVNKTKLLLVSLMLQAKRYAKDRILNTGMDQENWVVDNSLKYIPRKYLIVIGIIANVNGMNTEEFIRYQVRNLFDKLKDYADDGLFNKSNGMNIPP